MTRYIEGKFWPTRYDYDIALDNLRENMLDPDLRLGEIQRQPTTGTLVHRGRPDASTCLYRIDDWIIRCFCHSDTEEKEPGKDLFERYQKLDLFYQQNSSRVSSLVPISYIERGLMVDFYKYDVYLEEPTQWLRKREVPLVKMPFINGEALNDFIAIYRRNPQKMHALSNAWMHMANEMEAVHMAHGDLDLTNVLVTEDRTNGALVLKLIDYDNTWIPTFADTHYPLPEHGHEFFQHPSFFGKSQLFDETIDRFALLVIYISLQTLITYPELYDNWHLNDNCLLFRVSDYQAEQIRTSGRISQLRDMHVKDLDLYIDELSSCLHEKRMPRSLSTIASTSQQRDALANQKEEPEDRDWNILNAIHITDWDHVEYFKRAQPEPRAPQASNPQSGEESQATQPLPLPDEAPPPRYQRINERNQALNRASAPQPSLSAHQQRGEALLSHTAPTEQLAPQTVRTFPRPPANPAPAFPAQEPIALSPASNSIPYDPSSETRRTPTAEQNQPQPPTTTLATWVGCGIILLLILLTAMAIFLFVSLSHAASRSRLQPTHQLLFSGDSYVRNEHLRPFPGATIVGLSPAMDWGLLLFGPGA